MMQATSRRPMAEINVTPLVDVVLVLLIIFMVTAPFLQGGLEVNLPHVATHGLDVHEGLIVSIRADQTIAVGNAVVPLASANESTCGTRIMCARVVGCDLPLCPLSITA